jgi:hypothetical protein
MRWGNCIIGRYSSPNVIKTIKSEKISWVRYVVHMEEINAQSVNRNPEVRGPLGKPRRRWEDSIKIILKK